jgi:peroxiredoxin
MTITLVIAAISLTIFWSLQNKPAPSAVFHTITGKTITLAEEQGHPLIVTFWASDCRSCIDEMPHLIELHQQFSAQGLRIIAVAMPYDPPNHVLEMARAKQLPYDVALDMQGEVTQAFGQVSLTPTTFLISPEGRIVFEKTGLFDLADMKQRIQDGLPKSST